ncbi:MAG: type VI secretion system baseplate subunit TssE [Desulfobacteraceae bacterium]|nr:type VI secretion system baseplate subunit TssE [Desulfobacteraceae bacterium]
MREGRLLERISRKGMNPAVKMTFETGKLVDSIIMHLQRLLNTRVGCTMIDEKFGMADVTEIVSDYPDALNDMKNSIKKMISKYEPRIKDVRVEFIDKDILDHTLRFTISGVLTRDQRNIPIFLKTKLNPDGHMQIKR